MSSSVQREKRELKRPLKEVGWEKGTHSPPAIQQGTRTPPMRQHKSAAPSSPCRQNFSHRDSNPGRLGENQLS